MFDYFTPEDRRLYDMLPHFSFLNGAAAESLLRKDPSPVYEVHYPTEEYRFLHETAVIEYHGTLFASWYHNRTTELQGETPICGRRSRDGGKTWTDEEILMHDPSGRIMYCPPVYGIDDDTLYMFVNEMVSADHIHALDLYRFNESTDRFEFLWSRPIPHKLNTNVVRLANGKLMLPGRIAELDGFPNTPSVLISDSGKIDAEWRLVYIQPDGSLPDGSQLVHPEISAILDGDTVYMFCRDDNRRVPLLYISRDNAEHWEGPFAHDIPFSNSKIYAGNLSDGRSYVIGNLYPGRSRLAAFFSESGTPRFTSGRILHDGFCAALGYGGNQWSYPVACESGGTLYVIHTAEVAPSVRGAAISCIELHPRDAELSPEEMEQVTGGFIGMNPLPDNSGQILPSSNSGAVTASFNKDGNTWENTPPTPHGVGTYDIYWYVDGGENWKSSSNP